MHYFSDPALSAHVESDTGFINCAAILKHVSTFCFHLHFYTMKHLHQAVPVQHKRVPWFRCSGIPMACDQDLHTN